MENNQKKIFCDEIVNDTNEMEVLLQKFENVKYVLDNAALVTALLQYLFNKSQEYFSLLYYYTVQKYQKVNETKNSMRNYNHINMEIYTVFIHSKAILRIPLKNEDFVKDIEDHIDTEDCINYFTKTSEWIVKDVIDKYINEFKDSIQQELDSNLYIESINNGSDRVKELKGLETLHTNIQNCLITNQKSRCLPHKKSDFQNPNIFNAFQIRAIILGFNTQYEYFLHDKKYSYLIKNSEYLTNDKTFLSNSTVKLNNKVRFKNHHFEEHSLSRVAFCLVCDVILWGPYPQCLYCRYCKKVIHRDCKESVDLCQSEIKKSKRIDFNSIDSEKEKKNEDLIDEVSHEDNINSLFDQSSSIQTFSNEASVIPDYDRIQYSKFKEKSKPSRKLSFSMLQDIKWPIHSFTNTKVRKASMKSNISDWDSKRSSLTILRSESVGSLNNESYFSINNNKSFNSEEDDQNLLQDNDYELNVPETFDPIIEKQQFSNEIKKSIFNNDGEYRRLLVLMEFHHKIRFIRMTLKKIKYIFVDPWMTLGECMELFESLSLNCIEKLYMLIGSLVNVVDLCKGEYSYNTTVADEVLLWLSKDEDNNITRWLQLSINLCCTNVLNSIKAGWSEQKQMSAKLNYILSKEINRMRIIEQLSNMRSLLFNLPMIVTKIVKDLERFNQFKDEAIIWGNIGQKLSRLPQLIEIRCMPVVHLVNNGIIMNSSLKYKKCKNETDFRKEMEIYINNFPKTIFKNNFVDFQFVKISTLRESSEGETKLKQSSVYVKDEIDVAAICYDKELILLQKENEKYLLKQFKSQDANKLLPVIQFNHIHVTKQTIKENKHFQHELTILILDPAILVKINFKEEESRDMWLNHIIKITNKICKEITIETPNSSVNTTFSVDQDCEDINTREDICQPNSSLDNSRVSIIKASFNETLLHLQRSIDLISNEMQNDEVQNKTIKEIKETGPNSPNQFLVGFINLLKEYTFVGSQIINKNMPNNSNNIIVDESILNEISNLSIITQQMMTLLKYPKQINSENEHGDNATIGDESKVVYNESETMFSIDDENADIQENDSEKMQTKN